MNVGATLPGSGALSAGEIGESNGRLFITSGRMKVGSTLPGFANTSSMLPAEMPWAWAAGLPSPATENRTAKVRVLMRLQACSLLLFSMGRPPHTAGPHTPSKLKPHIGFQGSNCCRTYEDRRMSFEELSAPQYTIGNGITHYACAQTRRSQLVGHLVRSSVLCGPVSCREVDHVAATNESVARLECGGADGVDAVEPVAAYAGGSGRAGGGVAGGCRRAELHSRRAEGRTPRQRHRGGVGGALQPRGPAGGGAAAWRRSADPLRRCGAAAHSGRSPADTGTHAGRHRDVVVEHAATGLAPGRRWSADHQYLHDLAGAAPSGSELAEEPDLVRYRRGRAQTGRGHGQRP